MRGQNSDSGAIVRHVFVSVNIDRLGADDSHRDQRTQKGPSPE